MVAERLWLLEDCVTVATAGRILICKSVCVSLQDIQLDMCASPVPPGPESVEALERYKEKLGAFASSPDITGLLWKPVPVRFAVRLMFAKVSFVQTQCRLHQQKYEAKQAPCMLGLSHCC